MHTGQNILAFSALFRSCRFMSGFAEQLSMLERALADAIPESRDWVRHTDAENWSVEVSSPHTRDDRKLTIDLWEREIEVRFYVGRSGVGGAPYEANADVPAGKEAETIAGMVSFVADILNERLVLAMERSVRGGRVFLEPGELTPSRRNGLKWIASWRGTYDWALGEPTASHG